MHKWKLPRDGIVVGLAKSDHGVEIVYAAIQNQSLITFSLNSMTSAVNDDYQTHEIVDYRSNFHFNFACLNILRPA